MVSCFKLSSKYQIEETFAKGYSGLNLSRGESSKRPAPYLGGLCSNL